MYPLLRIRSLPGSSGRSLITPPAPPPPITFDYFVSPTGGTGAGSFADPWSLSYALSNPGGVLGPGKKIGFRGGQYLSGGVRSFSIAGAASPGGVDDITNSIIWRAYNRERAEIICDAGAASIEVIQINARNNVLWDLEVWRKKTDRYNYPGPGSNIWIRNASTTGTKLIDCVTHEGSNGVFTDSVIGDVEIYGHIAYHAGVSTDPRAHGFYCHHTRSGATRFKMTNYTSFNHLGLCGQLFASGAPDQLDDFDIDCVIAWHGGRIALVTGQQNLSMGGTDGVNIPLRGSTFRRIHSWNPIGYGRSPLRFYGTGSNGSDAIIEDNYLVGGSDSGLGRLYLQSGMGWTTVAVRRNTMVSLNAVAILRTEDTIYTAYTWEDNHFYGSPAGATRWHGGAADRTWAAWKTFTGLGNSLGHEDTESDSLPTSTYVLVRNNDKYEAGRGIVAYWNWASLTYIPANLSGFLAPGESFAVKNVQDLWGPDITVYSDAAGLNPITTVPGDGIVWFPTTGVTPPTPYGFNNLTLDAWVNLAPVTAPFFDEFIVRKAL